MFDYIIKLVIGDMEEKREYKQMIKKVDALPKEYKFAFGKIKHCMYSIGSLNGDMIIFTDLVDLFESSAAEGRQVLEVIGSDLGNKHRLQILKHYEKN